LQRTYGFYKKEDVVKNVHLPQDGHDYGFNKRKAMYEFIAQQFGLNINAVKDKSGNIDESNVTIEKPSALYVFGENGERLPSNAVKGFDAVTTVFEASVKK
ncbi:MAG: acetylxylan esterase, partial [Flavisolibacter sp.]|nr:acetylxylan esterase [Flavisolibacter sp.]